MIFLPNDATSLRTVAFFSSRAPNIKTEFLANLEIDSDFCTCITQCVPKLPVFTDEIGTDFYKNDKTSLFARTLNSNLVIGSSTVFQIVNVITGVVTPLVNTTHGTLTQGIKFDLFEVDWFKIYSTLGYGKYRLEFKTTVSLYLQILDSYCSTAYHLKPYSDKLANGTVRLEFEQNGKLNHSKDFSNLLSLTLTPVVFRKQVRLPGSLKFESMNEETDHLTLNGKDRPSYQIKDQIRPEYTLDLHLVSSAQVVETLFNDLFANPVNVTDYNVYNFVADVDNYSATKYRSIKLMKKTSNFSATSKQKRKSFSFAMALFNDKIFKTNN
tara:strand:- start:3775 stop:4752 length:978 start_codon:yes stop_codon:yes gene_type:complete